MSGTSTGAEPFVLCADDYGFAPGVSAGIRELLQAGRLSATACLVASPHWRAEAPPLRALDVDADIGLHLALTQVAPLGPMPGLAPSGRLPTPAQMILMAYSGRLDRDEIGREIDRQLDAFEQAMGRPPDYVDGHHHMQQLPVVRDALIERFRTRLPRGTALRVCHEPLGAILARRVALVPALVISAIGTGLRRAADAAGIAGNRRFAGVRSFGETTPYRALFRRFIQGSPRGLAVMCHPGHPDDHLRALDSVVEPRTGELQYLAGAEFPDDLAAAGLRLGRFRDLPPVAR
jgi:predicted glycoside hydrolase/deacetylase ChbG (UPF0249 family)